MSYPQAPGPSPQNWPPAQPYRQHYQQPVEGIAVTTHYHPLSFFFALFKPTITVDGHQVPVTGWGRTVVPARPGRHHVNVHIPYWLPSRVGPADALVDVYPQTLAELEYRAPTWGFSPGSLGYPPQTHNGLAITIAVVFAVPVFVFLTVILMMLFIALV